MKLGVVVIAAFGQCDLRDTNVLSLELVGKYSLRSKARQVEASCNFAVMANVDGGLSSSARSSISKSVRKSFDAKSLGLQFKMLSGSDSASR